MKEDMKDLFSNWTCGFVTGVIVCMICFGIYDCKRQKGARTETFTEVADTCVTNVEKRVTEPRFEAQTKLPEKVYVTVSNPVYVPVVDSAYIDSLATYKRKNDSLVIALQRVQRKYRDSSYVAWVSGIDPKLDSLYFIVPEKTVYMTKTYKYKPKFNFGVQAGLGLVWPFAGTPNAGGYVGVGIQYNF